MSYTTDDFSESLSRVSIAATDIVSVEAAWGKGDGMGEEPNHYKWSDSSATDWSGGFLMRLSGDAYVYLTGWCDYTGWGCQDGAELHHFAERPTLQALRDAGQSGPPDTEWDIEPADLNRWLAANR